MIKQKFDVDGYWNVVVYYNVDYHFFDDIEFELLMIDFPKDAIEETRRTMQSGEAKAVTCSNFRKRVSVVLFNRHKNRYDYLNSIIHEAEHIKQHMLRAYNVDDEGEPPAYTIGYIAMRMLMINPKLKLL